MVGEQLPMGVSSKCDSLSDFTSYYPTSSRDGPKKCLVIQRTDDPSLKDLSTLAGKETSL